MESSELGVPGELAQKRALQGGVVLGNSVEQDPARLPHVVASLVILLTLLKGGTATALTLFLVLLMVIGGCGVNGQSAYLTMESALEHKDVKENVTLPSLNMGGATSANCMVVRT